MSDLTPLSNLKFRRIFDIIKFFDPNGFWSERFLFRISEKRPFGIKTVRIKNCSGRKPFRIKTFRIINRSKQWHFGSNIFRAMTLLIISLSDQRIKYSSEKRPFGIKTVRNKKPLRIKTVWRNETLEYRTVPEKSAKLFSKNPFYANMPAKLNAILFAQHTLAVSYSMSLL